MIVELAVWLAVSALLCDQVLRRPALFAFHQSREVLDPPSEDRLRTMVPLGRAWRRSSKSCWTVTLVAVAVVVIALLAGLWSSLVLLTVSVLGLQARRWQRNKYPLNPLLVPEQPGKEK